MTEADLESLVVQATSEPRLALVALAATGPGVAPRDLWLVHFARGLAYRTALNLDAAAVDFDLALDALVSRAVERLAADGSASAGGPGSVAENAPERERVLISRAGNRALQGNLVEALADLDAAAALRPTPSAQVLHQMAAVLAMAGRFDEAFATQTRALDEFNNDGATLWLARSYLNRSKMALLIGRPAVGMSDAKRARAEFRAIGHVAGEAKAAHNYAGLLALNGQIPQALSQFEKADAVLRTAGAAVEAGNEARIETLMVAGLDAEALRLARDAQRHYQSVGAELLAAEAALLGARAAAALEDSALCRELAEAAGATFVAQQRTLFALFARYVAETGDPRSNTDVHELTAALGLAGWRERAQHACAVALARALCRGDLAALESILADPTLAPAASSGLSGSGAPTQTWDVIIGVAWYVHRSSFDEAEQLLRGRVDELRRRGVSGYDLNIAKQAQIRQLAELGLRVAALRSDAKSAWYWMGVACSDPELERAGSATTRRLEVSLRALIMETTRAELTQDAGAPDELARKRADTELRLREEERRLTPRRIRQNATPATTPCITQVGAARRWPSATSGVGSGANLGLLGRPIVRLQRCGQHVLVCVRQHGQTELRSYDIQPLDAAVAMLRREVLRFLSGPATAETARRVQRGADRFDLLVRELLGAALDEPAIDQPGVLLMTDTPLSQWPWALAPSLAPVAFSVLANESSVFTEFVAGGHARSLQPGKAGVRVTLVAGPGLDRAYAELDVVHESWPDAILLSNGTATVGRVRRALVEHDIVHIAAHGVTRGEHPELSSVQLWRGELTMRDLIGVSPRASLVVLGSCDAAAGASSMQRAHRSFAERLVAWGVRNVIGAPFPVSDRVLPEVMGRVHNELRSGVGPADALRRVRTECRHESPELWLAASTLTCFGDGMCA